jgi:hypothetical protein
MANCLVLDFRISDIYIVFIGAVSSYQSIVFYCFVGCSCQLKKSKFSGNIHFLWFLFLESMRIRHGKSSTLRWLVGGLSASVLVINFQVGVGNVVSYVGRAARMKSHRARLAALFRVAF